jgi:hypothetical protein
MVILWHAARNHGCKLQDRRVCADRRNGPKWLTTAKLPVYLHEAAYLVKKDKEVPEYTKDYVKTRNDRINKCLRLSQDVWEESSILPEGFNIPSPMSSEVALGIDILAITLHAGATEMCGRNPGEPIIEKCFGRPAVTGELLEMISQGCCPTVVRTDKNLLGSSNHLYLITPERLRTKIGPYTSFSVDAPQASTEACFLCVLQGRKYFVKRSPFRRLLHGKG